MEKLTKSLRWIDDNLLKIFLTLFIFIIPLYPKLPFKSVDYTYIAIRLEDLFIAIMTIVFVIQLLRRKVTLSTRFLIPIVIFWAAVFLSFWYGAFIQKTIQIHSVGFLNAARRVEYMIVFFIAASVIKSKKDFYYYLNMIFIVLGLVSIYGIGQKFLGFPAVQTMNPEFAKGYFLVLDGAARISSTFGGHYDLAAYLILLMPIILGAYLSYPKIKHFVIFVIALLALVLTASRISYGSYILSTFPFLLFRKKFKMMILVIALTVAFTPLAGNLTKRISQTFQPVQVFRDPTTGKDIVPEKLDPNNLPPGDFTTGGKTTGADNLPIQADPVAAKRVKQELRDKYIKDAEKDGKPVTAEELVIIDQKVEADFSKLIPVNVVAADISLATRVQVEWPRAVNAFLYNPILGKGPGSITEATDGDYFRWLGEFGLFGTLSFLYLLGSIMWFVFSHTRKIVGDENHLFYGFLFGMIGLLGNATFIDVFEASKVAFYFWLLAGLFTSAVTLYSSSNAKAKK